MSSVFHGRVGRHLPLDDAARRDVQIVSLLVLVAVIFYLPGIVWGLPVGDSAETKHTWVPDEIVTIVPLAELWTAFTRERTGNPQYPLFHHMVLTAAYTPYLAFEWLSGGLQNPAADYPYGFTEPVRSLQRLMSIARGVSVLMGAAVVLVVYFLAKSLWSRTAGVLAGLFLLFAYPMVYYSRTANVDVPALFWCALVFLLFARVMQDGLPVRRAVWLGVWAGLAVATKDQYVGLFLLPPAAMLPLHLQALPEQERKNFRRRWGAPLLGLFISAGVYAATSGLAIWPEKYFRHLEFIRAGSGCYYFKYPATWQGYADYFVEILELTVASLGWPICLAAGVGILLCLVRERHKLLLLLPIVGLLLVVLVPVRYVAIRFLLPVCLLLACFAAAALARGLHSPRSVLRILSWGVVAGGIGLLLLRGADLTYLMLRDSRYIASAWLAREVQDGERVEFFGPDSRIRTLPQFRSGIIPLSSNIDRTSGQGRLSGEFVLTVGPADQEDFLWCPQWAYEGLHSGRLGYDLVAVFQTQSWMAHPDFPQVNPRVEVFARRKATVVTGP